MNIKIPNENGAFLPHEGDAANGCPKCGCQKFYAKIYGCQFYSSDGEPMGYEVDGETKTLFCYNCGHRISRSIFQK